jgi:hypothetical protein
MHNIGMEGDIPFCQGSQGDFGIEDNFWNVDEGGVQGVINIVLRANKFTRIH